MSCSGLDIFGDDTCQSSGGLTPGQEQDLDDVVEKTQNQDATAGNTNFSGVLTLNGVPVGSGGGGDVSGPANSADNGVCFYNGVSGKIIKEVSTIKYNPIPNSLAVPDLSTTATTSLNTDLQKISNISSAVQLPIPVTEFNGAIASSGDIKVYDPTGADPDQSILKKDRLEFSGIPADNALGRIFFEDGASYKQIIMSVDKGNFPFQSRGVISVDGGNFQFNPNEFAMLNKRITLLSDPISVLDATNKQYVDQKFVDPVINSSITLENQTTPNTLLLASFATGENRIESAGNLEINGSNLTMNLTGGTLTENVGNNKISLISGNLTEAIAANKVSNITAAHISTASSHTFNGALTSSTSVTTPTIIATQIYPTTTSLKLNGDVIGGVSDTYIQITSTDINIIANSDLTIRSTNDFIILQGKVSLNNTIDTTKTTFTNDQELVTKKYVDDLITGYELIFAVTDQISNITTVGQKFQIRAPRNFTISKIKLSLNSTAGSSFLVELLKNNVYFSSITPTLLVQDVTSSETFTEDDIISVEISNIGTGTASGLIIYLIE
jgi:hypothetical protein